MEAKYGFASFRGSVADALVLGALSFVCWRDAGLALQIAGGLFVARMIRPFWVVYCLAGGGLWVFFLWEFFSHSAKGVLSSNTWQAVLVIGVVAGAVLVGLFLRWLAGVTAMAQREEDRPPEAGNGDENGGSQKVSAVLTQFAFDPYQVLGVERGAGQEEIRRCYREKLNQYHPDRVAHLGEELQAVAHEKTIEIQRAWEELGGQMSVSISGQ